jgi:hypothetical protein
VAELTRISPPTVHLAVRYFDLVLLRIKATPSSLQLQLIILTCIFIAAKFAEHVKVTQPDSSVRFSERLIRVANAPAISKQALFEMETIVLQHLDWRLHIPTPAHFLELVAHCGVVFTNDTVVSPLAGPGPDAPPASPLTYTPTNADTVSLVRKYMSFFAELYLQESAVQHYLPSVACAAVIACSRRAVGVTPIWNALLEKTTGCREDEVYNCYAKMFDFYVETFPDVQKGAHPDAVSAFEAAVLRRSQQVQLQHQQQQL